MKKTIIALVGLGAFAAVQAQAQDDMMVEDTDGDGMYSMEEITVAYPDVTEEQFTEMDTDGDGSISEEELTAAMDAGMLGEDM
ncbi:hypothetical protein [Tranquillimonas alkanivorans]|uniref:EF hand domain-containing protein n=1 Tax=Tranquillimonas alkanivorans TaxID=441119 RepID=A0A1I5NRS7_9RHOB|nr:hypothetical protein [Tranquillimonas alkanivorans]SFP24525.1 EF hand domain-containing protein [Tranquillimonas alkanivorans]